MRTLCYSAVDPKAVVDSSDTKVADKGSPWNKLRKGFREGNSRGEMGEAWSDGISHSRPITERQSPLKDVWSSLGRQYAGRLGVNAPKADNK
jgi:hypothetical protein